MKFFKIYIILIFLIEQLNGNKTVFKISKLKWDTQIINLTIYIYFKGIFHDNTNEKVNEIVSHCISIINSIQKKNSNFQLEYSIYNGKNSNDGYNFGKPCNFILF